MLVLTLSCLQRCIAVNALTNTYASNKIANVLTSGNCKRQQNLSLDKENRGNMYVWAVSYRALP